MCSSCCVPTNVIFLSVVLFFSIISEDDSLANQNHGEIYSSNFVKKHQLLTAHSNFFLISFLSRQILHLMLMKVSALPVCQVVSHDV